MSLFQRLARRSGARRGVFGRLAGGAPIEAVDLWTAAGLRARIVTYGAALVALQVPDRRGRLEDVVLGCKSLDPYVQSPRFAGATIGRFANRIGGARFTLDGAEHALRANDARNLLHGGAGGFDKVHWRIQDLANAPEPSVTLTHVSPDGEEGFPGTAHIEARYTLTAGNALVIAFSATTDKPTIVSLTHHSYFNLAGARPGRTILDHQLTIDADAYLPVDAALIPTGERRSVAGAPFDFREAARIGARIDEESDAQIAHGAGFDHTFVLRGGASTEPKRAARLHDPASGRTMDLFTTEPGLQLYAGNRLRAATHSIEGAPHHPAAALCLEPQAFPDAPNKPDFPSARLDPGAVYKHISIYRFSPL